MSEDSVYNDADIVWVKLGNSWWPGEVCGQQRQPDGFLKLAKRKPYCVVKFFQEDTFEYVKSSKHILPFNCSKKDEFIRKGHELFKAKKKFMEKFPSDVSTAERLTRSVTRSTLFFNSRPDSIVKAILGQSPAKSDLMRNGGRCDSVTKIMNLTPNRNTETRSLPSTPATYKCSLCDFQSTRQNVMVLHRKSHSNTPATTRSSLVNNSTNTSPIEVTSRTGSVSQTISVGTSPPPANSIGRKTPVARKTISIQSNDTVITVDDESDCSSEEIVLEKSKSTNISVVDKSNDVSETKNLTITTVQDSPVHKTEENANVLANKNDLCKSVEIQKSLLADWMDEDKDDDEEERTSSEIKSKAPKEAIPEPTEKESNSALTISAPTSPEILKGVDLTYIGETSSSSESSKPSARIRNIPKKDRRNINFTDFKEDEKVELPNKTSKEPDSSKKIHPTLIDLVDDSSNETVSKQHDVPMTMDTSTNKQGLCEVDLLVKTPPVQSKAITDDRSKEQSESLPEYGLIESKCIQQDSTPETDQSNKDSPKETLASLQFTVCTKETPAIAMECDTEPCVRIESNTDSPQNASSVSDLLNTETTSPQTFTEEITEDLKTKETGASIEAITPEYSQQHLVPSSPTKSTPEHTDLIPDTETLMEEEHTTHSQQSHENSVHKDITENVRSIELPSKENVGMEVSVDEQSEVEPMTNETEAIITTKESHFISVNNDTPTEEMCPKKLHLEEKPALPGSEEQSEFDLLAKELSGNIKTTIFNESEESVTLTAPETRCSPVSETLYDVTEIERQSQDAGMEESKVEEQSPSYLNNEDGIIVDKTTTRNSPLIGIQVDESADADKCVLPKNDEPDSQHLSHVSTEQTVLQTFEDTPPQVAEECSTQTNVETPNNQQEEKCDKEESTVALATVATTPTEKEVINHVEIAESKMSKSVNKTSLSCFDFEEEEDNDILTSIAKFKKKNISSERNSDIGKDSRPKTPDAQKYERELKDKQLSAEIESLLKTTEILVPTNSSTSAEVRGLPIKERGKRIFKSRNRFTVESCSSVSTTTTTTTSAIKKTESSFSSPKMEEEVKPHSAKPLEPEQESVEKVNQESDKVSDQVHVEESVVDKMSFDNDDKVTNSEEEIVGRVVFSPAEVYAPSPENNVTDYSENTDAQVSSSGMEIVSESLSVSDGNVKEISTEESTNTFPTEDSSKDLEDNSNNYENVEVNESEKYQSENEPYYEVIEEGQLEAIVQFVQNDEAVDEDMEDIQQEVNDQLNEFFVVEESEPIYEEEVSYEDVSNKVIDPVYENSNDYELITTEVSSIVERIASEENSVECDNETLQRESEICETKQANVELNNRLSTDCNLAIFSTTDNAVIDSQCTLVRGESGFSEETPSTQPDNVILSEESNTCSTVENISKSSYNDKDIQQDDKLVQSQVERPEISSDENSTIISEAEAEFGSPTSMLEEDRVLKRARRGSETSTTNIECPKSVHNSRVHKNEVIASKKRLCRKDNALLSDTNESGSNDVQSSSSNINDSEKEGGKENVDNIILKVIQKELLKMKEKEATNRVEDTSPINDGHLSELNTDTDTDDEDEEDEEEISSPPIEPLQDEHVEELYPDMHESSVEYSNKEKEKTDIREEVSSDATNVEKVILIEKNDVSHNSPSDGEHPNESPSSVCTLTPSTETVIKSNRDTDVLTETTASHVMEQTSDIAGEELSAAEALLSIPNQPGSNLGELNDLSTLSAVSVKSPSDENESTSITEIEVKDEPMDGSDMPLKSSEHTPKEFIRRKGRSHMKVTPRKRIIDSGYSDKLSGQELSAKIPKLSNDALPSSSKAALNDESPEHQTEMSEAVSTSKTDVEKSLTPEKVHITVDISNPLSSQIVNILNSMDPSDVATKIVAQKRKQTLEDDITSFVIKKPSPTTDAEAEAADRETIAQLQNLCPQVEVRRKSSKDEQTSLAANSAQTSMPIILNSQVIRPGNNQPIITVTPKSKNPDEAFDISNMPIVLSNENVINEKVHLVITPTSNPQIIKQFQNQQQLVLNQRADSFSPSPVNTTIPRITTRRQSNLRTKRTLTRQQIQEQNTQKEQEIHQKTNQEDCLQPHILQQHYNPQPQVNIHQQQQQQQQQQQPTQLQQHKRQQQFKSNQQVQLHSQHSPAQYQNQFQLHQQQKLQQQLQEEQNILIQQHQQQMIVQQQMQMQQHQQRPQQQRQQQQMMMHHQQVLPVENKSNHLNTSDKQMGVDARGKKYVIIKAPSNTVVMDNNPETIKGGLQNLPQSRCQQMTQQKNTTAQRKQRQTTNANKKQLSHQLVQPVTTQTIPNIKTLNQTSTVTQLPPSSLPHVIPVSHHPVHSSANISYTNEAPQRYFKEQQTTQLFTPTMSSLPGIPPAKGRGSGRGRRAKQIATVVPTLPTLDSIPKNVKSNANGRRTTGTYCESPRHRTTRSTAAKKNTNSALSAPNDRQSSLTSEFSPTTTAYQSTAHMSSSQCSVNTVNTVTTISTAIATSLPMKGQPLSDNQGVTADIPIEKSRGSGGCYAVPALPVPGFPHTFLVCELIDNKYREAYAKLLYLSPDGSRLCEIPDELVTEAHLKLRDDQREPNPDYIQVGSGALQIDKSIRVHMSEEHKQQTDGKMDNNGKSNEVFMQKHDSLSVQEQASALLCLQEQIAQEQLAQEQLVQKQYVQEHLVHEQLVHEQLAQEQLVQEQLVQEQFVQEHFVQDQFGREQFVQEQFVQEQFVPEQFVQDQIAQEQLVREQFMQHHHLKGDQDILHVTHSMENDEAHDSIIQQLDSDTVVMDESAESPNAVVLNIGSQHLVLDHTAFMNMCENNTEGMSPGGNIFTLTQEGLQELLNSYNSTRNETSAMVFAGEGCEQRVMMNENILHTDDTSPDGLRIALNDPRLYAEEQFINSGSILQIETPDGLRLISTAPGSSGIVIQSMPSEGKTCDANILDQQGHKSSPAHDEKHSDNIKSKFETDPSATTLDDCLNVIGVSTQSPPVPTSLELSHSEMVTKNRVPSPGTIVMNEIVATGLCHHPDITSLPSMSSNEQDIHYGFFSSNTGTHNDKVNANGESVVTDMDEYTVGSSGGNFDDPGR